MSLDCTLLIQIYNAKFILVLDSFRINANFWICILILLIERKKKVMRKNNKIFREKEASNTENNNALDMKKNSCR